MSENLAYQDEHRQELIDGKVVMMSPRPSVNHSRVASNIFWLFENYLREKKCTPFDNGVDLYLTKKDRFIPDMMVVCDPGKIEANGVHGAPDLVVEVLSPSTIWNDRIRKKEVYARCGVWEYWIVNPVDKSVEQYFLENSEFVLHYIYVTHADWELEQMTEEERASVVTHFKCSLFDDLDIHLKDIFHRTF